MSKKLPKEKLMKIDFDNDDGTVDEWIYDLTYTPPRPIQVTINIRRRTRPN